MSWLAEAPEFRDLAPEARKRLDALAVNVVPKGTVLFRPGDPVNGYVIVLTGQISANLVGPTGREIVLYTIGRGQSCIQTTLGLLGDDPYTAEAVADTDARVVVVPRALFFELTDTSAAFRTVVLTSFAGRLQSMMILLEKLAFQRVEGRLAATLLTRSGAGDHVTATQAQLAAEIGSAREVVSRRLDGLEKRGIVAIERGHISIRDRDALAEIAKAV